ncbi:Peroxiredoxin [Xylanibacter oryzae DSM 17970]|uniref:Peroxiredoxin n=1 Tax=Xylanibacter oryzae DSM 17970 TaxID=915438 RepID=A0ABP3BC88_9BACT|nr:redoxin domain-containing protein [Xylanibacter oryzae]EXG77746.1 Peroxiredoxin [Xylanibacter oryzae DSM 17970]
MRKVYVGIFLSILTFTISLVIYVLVHRQHDLYSSVNEKCLNSKIKDINARELKKYIKYSKKTLLFFGNSDCDYCQNEISYIENHAYKFENRYNLIFVSFETTDVLKEFASKNKLNDFFIVSDEKCELMDKYKVKGFPTLFLFSTKGKIIMSHNGAAINTLKMFIR